MKTYAITIYAPDKTERESLKLKANTMLNANNGVIFQDHQNVVVGFIPYERIIQIVEVSSLVNDKS